MMARGNAPSFRKGGPGRISTASIKQLALEIPPNPPFTKGGDTEEFAAMTANTNAPSFLKGGLGRISVTLKYQPKLKQISRNLRSNQTDSEQLLWSRLRRRRLEGVQFYRQRPIGRYVVDFYAPTAKLVIEVDGGQHYEPTGRQLDVMRDDYLRSVGLCVLRFSNLDVMRELNNVLEVVLQAVLESALVNPPQPPFRKGGGGVVES